MTIWWRRHRRCRGALASVETAQNQECPRRSAAPWKSQFELFQQRPSVQPRGEMGVVALARGLPRNNTAAAAIPTAARDRSPSRNRRCPARSRKSAADSARHCNGDAQCDPQSDGRTADAVEEAEQRPQRNRQRSAEHARKPIVESEPQGFRRNIEGREYPGAAETEYGEQGTVNNDAHKAVQSPAMPA